MPANDVELIPIYSAATIYRGQTETPFETLKEAFANVKDGDVIKLDWNVTLTETVETLLRNGAIKFTLDLNGYIIDGMTPEYAIRLRNGDLMTITDSSLGQTGGLKCQNSVGEQGAMFIFDGGRYTMGQATADLLNEVCSKATAALLLASGKEFTDIENAPDADGFTVRVGEHRVCRAACRGRRSLHHQQHRCRPQHGHRYSYQRHYPCQHTDARL